LKDFKTILVLDDDPQFHRLIVPVLTGRGHRVISAHNGKEATEYVAKEAVDLAIVDGQLTDTNGIAWISEFRANGHDALVMFVSAYWRDAQSYHKLTKELGVTLVLHKPVIAAVFAAEVDILLGKTSAMGQETHDFADTLLALRAEYADELPARLEELTGLVSQLRDDTTNSFLQSEARTHAHKLRGTAASYGFKEIGEHAAQIEELLIALKGKGGSDVSNLFSNIDTELESARRLAAEAVGEQAKPSSPSLPTSADAIDGNAIAKILVVDDDAAFLDLIDELARQRDIEIIRASNPSEALDMACMVDLDAALVDVELGAREIAFRLASDLRNLPGYSNLPLAFLSGSGHIEQQDHEGEFVYIAKPTKADALQSAVRQLIAIRDVTRPKIMIIDDDIDFTRRIAFVLTHDGMEVRSMNNTENILQDMQKYAPDALLLDVMMPGVSGFDICRMLRTIPRWRDLPITFTTAYSDVDTRIACLRCGGDDYLIKPVVNEELMTRLKMQLERARILKQRLEHDNVSGLLLRESFMNQLSTMISEGRRQGWNVSLAFGRVVVPSDDDPLVSDTVLTTLGSLLHKRLRPEDLKGLWGSDKVILAFRNEEAPAVLTMLRRVADDLQSMQIPSGASGVVAAAFHFGVAQFPYDGGTIHELLETAERRLTGKERPSTDKRVSA
jgi:DNA-binding response OmpR family regulator